MSKVGAGRGNGTPPRRTTVIKLQLLIPNNLDFLQFALEPLSTVMDFLKYSERDTSSTLHLLYDPFSFNYWDEGGGGRTGAGWGDRVTNCPITMTILCESSAPAPAPHSHSHFYKSNLSINTRLRTEDGGGYSVQSALSAAPRGLLQMIREGYYLDQRRVEAGRLGTGQESIAILTSIPPSLWKF